MCIKFLFTIFITLVPFLQAQQTPMISKNDKSDVDNDQIIKEYKKLIDKYPDKKGLHYNLGNINYVTGELEDAIENYNSAIETKDKKQKAYALYNLGNAHFEKGDIEKVFITIRMHLSTCLMILILDIITN